MRNLQPSRMAPQRPTEVSVPIMSRRFALSLSLAAALATMALTAPWTAGAQSPEEKGLEIAREVDTRDMGWEDTQVELTMLLRNQSGDESSREMRIRSLEVLDDGDKSLVIFDSPRDVAGTKLLTFSHKVEEDDQWIYLPALKRAKRIASRNKSGPFVGSEYSYEDMTPQEVEKFTYRYDRDEVYESMDCFVVERFPVDKNSGYSRQVVWVDKEEYRIWKIDFYDRKDSHLKTLTNADYKLYLEKHWRPHESEMQNHQTGKSTALRYQGFEFQTGLSDRDFNKNRLQSLR